MNSLTEIINIRCEICQSIIFIEQPAPFDERHRHSCPVCLAGFSAEIADDYVLTIYDEEPTD